MRFIVGMLLVNCGIFSLSVYTHADTDPLKQNILSLAKVSGRAKAEDNRCIECHGADGNGNNTGQSHSGSLGKFPKLAGQYQDYLLKQLRDFRSDKRKHDLMSLMAKALDEEDLLPLAQFFAQQKKMQGDGSGNNPLAKSLYTVGDAQRNIAPCSTCHGINGKGVDGLKPQAPIIGGQEVGYLVKQLEDWRTGERRNSDGQVMNAVAKALTDSEIQALANYLSGL